MDFRSVVNYSLYNGWAVSWSWSVLHHQFSLLCLSSVRLSLTPRHSHCTRHTTQLLQLTRCTTHSTLIQLTRCTHLHSYTHTKLTKKILCAASFIVYFWCLFFTSRFCQAFSLRRAWLCRTTLNPPARVLCVCFVCCVCRCRCHCSRYWHHLASELASTISGPAF